MITKREIKELVNRFCKENGIEVKLSFSMQRGYENAFGSFDVCQNILFINFDKIKTNDCCVFYIYHELRHALQYLKPEIFDRKLVKSLCYVVLYDGTCFKLARDKWLACKLKGQDFLNIYLSFPYEIDANKYAYQATKLTIKQNQMQELEKIYQRSVPTKKVSDTRLSKIYHQIDKLAK